MVLTTLLCAKTGLKIALEAVNLKPKVKIVVFGTPAEEGGGGKILMINNGCFKGVDFCLMVHPCPYDVLKPSFLALENVTVNYKGHAAHAAAFPWEGINALDAAVMAYNNISMLRQQMKPTWRVHGIISEGGVKPNIIPEQTQLRYTIRAPTSEEVKVLRQKVTGCFEAAATATGKRWPVLFFLLYQKTDLQATCSASFISLCTDVSSCPCFHKPIKKANRDSGK